MSEPTSMVSVKIVLIGDGMVGKTTMVKSFLMGRALADTSYRRTIGADIYVKESVYDIAPLGPLKMKWLIWDLAGQPIFREVRAEYYRGSQAAIAVFDVSRPETFRNVPFWINEFFKHTGGPKPMVLVGNKVDLRDKMPCLSPDYGIKYAQKLSEATGFRIDYLEASALHNVNVEDVFKKLAETIIRGYIRKKTKSNQ